MSWTLQIEVLQRFEKPDPDFLNDKECLICLEPMVLEMNQLVKLPCGCANSAYHIRCVIQLLQSGENKNFCPHCRQRYTIFVEPVVPTRQLPNNNQLLRIEEAYQAQQFSHIMQIHLLSNTTMNIVNLTRATINNRRYGVYFSGSPGTYTDVNIINSSFSSSI